MPAIKYLTHYIEEAQSQLYAETGAFFAFSKQQFDEAKKPNVKYMSLGYGMICPEEHAQKLVDGMTKIVANGIAQDMAENGKTAIISRELHNHEAFYTGDISDTVSALDGYGFTRDDVAAVYDAVLPTVDFN